MQTYHLKISEITDFCPAQYFIHLISGDKQISIGYIRLRFGELEAFYPDASGCRAYYYKFANEWKGSFVDDEEKMDYLIECIESLVNYYNEE